jgi:hypothetical protein
MMMPMFLSTLLACSNDKGVAVYNAPPEAAFTSHEMGDEVYAGSTETFSAALTDANHDAESLVAAWFAGGEEICVAAAPDGNGDIHCSILMEPGREEVKVEVRDPKNAIGSSTITLVIVGTEAPVVDILTPVADGGYYADVPIDFTATVSDAEDLAEDLQLSWLSDVDPSLSLGTTADSDGSFAGSGLLVAGEHLITLTATDSLGETGSDSVSIVVGPENSPPDCAIVSPADGSAGSQGDLVVFDGTASDADSPSEELTATWISDLDGILGTGAPGSDGAVVLETGSLSVGAHQITLSVSDDRAGTCETRIVYTVDSCSPFAEELPYDGIDSNCDGLETLNDQDGDGSPDDDTMDYNGDGVADLGVECAGTYDDSGTGVYFLFCDHMDFWEQANEFCTDSGYDSISSVHSAAENSTLVSLMESVDADLNPGLPYDFASGSFLGYSKLIQYHPVGATIDGDGFAWVDGSGPGYTNWNTGEPNGTDAYPEHCLEFIYNSASRGQWNDCYCYEGQNSTWPAPERRINCSKRP